MLGLSVIILFNLIFNVNSNLAESSANCSESPKEWPDPTIAQTTKIQSNIIASSKRATRNLTHNKFDIWSFG